MYPIRSLRAIRQRIAFDAKVRQVIRRGKQRYSCDRRYCVDLVDTGFTTRTAETATEITILQRICRAYQLAVKHEQTAPTEFAASNWWQTVRKNSLATAMRALAASDVHALRSMYRNFFRDPCGAGLVGLPLNLERSYKKPELSTRCKHLLLIDTLHRLDIWQRRTRGQYDMSALRSPVIGNPYGVLIDGVFLRTRAEEHHFYAQRLLELIYSRPLPVIAEIGGGFGGMAYYLLRDYAGLTYIGLDLPETVALASYFLMKTFPSLRFTLYGESPLDAKTISKSDVILMPSCALQELPASSVDAMFSAHVFPDLDPSSVTAYMKEIARTTRGYFLHTGCSKAAAETCERSAVQLQRFELRDRWTANWGGAFTEAVEDWEYLYALT